MVPYWYGHQLRLSEELASALREEAARRGKSQQDIVREAIAKELGTASELTSIERAVRAGTVEAPEPFRDVEPTLTLPRGTRSLDLLDRESLTDLYVDTSALLKRVFIEEESPQVLAILRARSSR